MMSVELCFGQVPDLTFLEGSMRVLATQYLSLDGVFEEPGKWRLSRVSWNLSGGPPPEACRGVGVGRRQDTNQEGDHRDQQVPEIATRGRT
jgi:hypothetical protein